MQDTRGFKFKGGRFILLEIRKFPHLPGWEGAIAAVWSLAVTPGATMTVYTSTILQERLELCELSFK